MKSQELELYRKAGLAVSFVDNKAIEFSRSWSFSQMNTFICSKLPTLFSYFAETCPQVLKTTMETVNEQVYSETLWPYVLLAKDRRVYTQCTIDYPTAEDYLDKASRSSGGGAWKERTIHLCTQTTYLFLAGTDPVLLVVTRDAIDRAVWEGWIDVSISDGDSKSSALSVPGPSNAQSASKTRKGKNMPNAMGSDTSSDIESGKISKSVIKLERVVKRARGKSKSLNLTYNAATYFNWKSAVVLL
jgi:hypothetical protein